jgi:two-component system sensor histidine kinase EvgS
MQEANAKRLKILVVDDEPNVRMIIAAYLNAHEVHTAENGVLGLEKFRAVAWDVVITDGDLGDITGWQLAAAIKETHPLTPVILVTGSNDVLPGPGERSPFAAALTKPFGRLAINAAVAKVCG